jgi:phosphonate transport system substrate-binding protein
MINSLILSGLLYFLSTTLPGYADETPALRIGFLPYIAPSELVERYTPLADYLGQRLGRTARIVVTKNYADHIQNLKNGTIDIAFLGAATYVKAVEDNVALNLLARYEMDGKPFLHSLILVRQNSPLKTLQDMRGKRMAFGDPNSTLSHLVPRAMLLNQGLGTRDLAELGFLGNHENVVNNVLFGRYDAGAIADEVYTQFKDKPLRVLARSAPYSAHVFVSANHVTAAEAAQIAKLLQGLKDSPDGMVALQAIGPPVTGFVAATSADYEPMRQVFKQLRAAGINP